MVAGGWALRDPRHFVVEDLGFKALADPPRVEVAWKLREDSASHRFTADHTLLFPVPDAETAARLVVELSLRATKEPG